MADPKALDSSLARRLWGGPPGLRGSSRTRFFAQWNQCYQRFEEAGVDAGRRIGVLPHKAAKCGAIVPNIVVILFAADHYCVYAALDTKPISVKRCQPPPYRFRLV